MVKLDYKQSPTYNGKILEIINKIKERPNLLKLLGDIDNSISNKRFILKKNNEKFTEQHRKEIIEARKEDAIISGDLEEIDVIEFFSLWEQMEKDNKIGSMLEHMILLNGSYEYDESDMSIHESKVYHEIIDTDHDIDVAFLKRDQTKIDMEHKKIVLIGNVEFHECKKNIATYIPCNIEYLKDDVKRKLEFMKKVKDILKENATFYMPTLVYINQSRQEFLEDNGYGFIKILGVRELLSKYYCNGQAKL